MTELMRVRARWSGFTGAPGYTVLHFRDFGSGSGGGGPVEQVAVDAAVTRVQTFFNAIKVALPNSVTINVDPVVDVLEDTTGELVDSFNAPTPATLNGTAGVNYASALGAVVNWRTGGIRNGRRIRGRSFLVPLASSSFGADGQMIAGIRTPLQNAATALADSTGTPDLGVYARPSGPGATDGLWAVCNSAQVPLLGAVLRSRRD